MFHFLPSLDVSAKDGSQETAVSLMGMILGTCRLTMHPISNNHVGLILTPLINGNQFIIWPLFIMFTFFHLFANYQAGSCTLNLNYDFSTLTVVSSVVMESLNRQRMSIAISFFLKRGGKIPTPYVLLC